MNLVFLGHQIPIIMTPGMAGSQGLAIGPEQSAASWKGTNEEGLQAYRERAWTLGEWHHLATTYDHEKLRLATYLNGKLIGSLNLTAETILDHRWGDWYLGGPGAFGSDQFFAGQMDDLRIHDAALTPDQIFAIYNGGEGDIGVTGQLTAPVVTKDQTIELSLAFSKYGQALPVSGITEAEINASLSNAQIVPGSLLSLDQNLTFSFSVQSDSGNKVIFNLPAGSGDWLGEPTLAVKHEIMIMPEISRRDEIIHWWWLDEGLGTEVSDSSGSSDGYLYGDATWSADSILGTGISFGMEGDYVALGSVDQNLSKQQFSVSFGSDGC